MTIVGSGPQRRTIVGSPPRRRELPDGDEARERAEAHSKFWHRSTAEKASLVAWIEFWRFPSDRLLNVERAVWLPPGIRCIRWPRTLKWNGRGVDPREES